MFNLSPEDVRRFFCDTFRKQRDGHIMTPLEIMAADWIKQHPEFVNQLGDVEKAVRAEYAYEKGQTNPFLHLSMHLSIAEQISVDQPPGIRAAFTTLARKLGSEHEAHHKIMDCLGQMIWQAQHGGREPDGAAYIECIRRSA